MATVTKLLTDVVAHPGIEVGLGLLAGSAADLAAGEIQKRLLPASVQHNLGVKIAVHTVTSAVSLLVAGQAFRRIGPVGAGFALFQLSFIMTQPRFASLLSTASSHLSREPLQNSPSSPS